MPTGMGNERRSSSYILGTGVQGNNTIKFPWDTAQ